MGPALFVVGTDTGVGKTRVATALCRTLRGRGVDVGVFKPVETGCAAPDRPADAVALIEASDCGDTLAHVCPYRFRDPLAPAVAAERDHVSVDVAQLGAQLEALCARHDLVIGEGAGGLLVPLSAGLLTIDWLHELGAPLLLVGRLGLGTLNHTLLSARYLRDRGIDLVGTILSATEPPTTVAEATNPQFLARYPEVKLLGVIPHGGDAELPTSVLPAVARRFPSPLSKINQFYRVRTDTSAIIRSLE